MEFFLSFNQRYGIFIALQYVFIDWNCFQMRLMDLLLLNYFGTIAAFYACSVFVQQGIDELEKCHHNQHSSVQSELKKEMSLLQKRILMDTVSP